MRILVTGNEGYIGSVLVPLLTGAGHLVRGMDTGLFRECALTPMVRQQTLRKDIRDVEAHDLDGVDAIIHLAGLANDPLGDLSPPITHEINHVASVRLAELAKQAGIERFLYASTCSVYGAAGEDLIDERTTPNPVTPYAESKLHAEQDIGRLADASFCPVFLRAATAYGVSPYLRFDLALNNLVAWAHVTQRVLLKSDGTSWRPLVHIQDIAAAYLALLGAPASAVNGQAFNVGATSENYRITDLARLVERTVDGATLEYAADASPDKRSYRVDCDRLHETLPRFRLGWNAQKGIDEVYAVLRGSDLQAEHFEGARYNRIAHIQHLMAEGRINSALRWATVDAPVPAGR